MILEGIVTTVSSKGIPNVAPMGPDVGAIPERFTLRPFRTSQTCRNLLSHPEGVLHVVDDVLLLARAALGELEPMPELFPAAKVVGWVLRDCCRYHEFRVLNVDDQDLRPHMEVEVVHSASLRDFFGFNRGKHAVIEAAILATRTAFLPLADIEAEYSKLAVLVAKTGGEREEQAFALLRRHIEDVARSQASRGEAREGRS